MALTRLRTGGIASGVAVQFSAGSVSAPALSSTDNTNTGIFFPAADTIAFAEGGAEAMRIDSSGNVGIGTSSPAALLHLKSTTSGAPQLRIEGVGTDNGIITFLGGGHTNPAVGIRYISTGDSIGNLAFYANGSSSGTLTERMGIDSSGNVGIGTSSPAHKLAIVGSDSIAAASMQITQSGNHQCQIALSNGFGNREGLCFLGDGSSGNTSFGVISTQQALTFQTAAFNIGGLSDLSTGWTERMRIDSSGNVGIGTSSPASILEVSGGTAAGILTLSTTSAGIPGAAIKMIGTTGAAKNWQIGNSFTAVNGSLEFTPSTTDGGTTFSTPAVSIDSSGNLLVGTTSGNFHRLHKSSASDFAVQCANTSATTPYVQLLTFTAATPNDATSMFLRCDDPGSTGRIQLRSNGGIANFQANDANLSDRREKTNFAPAGEYLSKICAIPVQTFNYIDQNMENDPGLTLGVVAQDVQEVAPELVMESNWGTEDNPKMRLSIYQTDLQYALMKCIQEQQAIINDLKARLDAANL